MAEHKARKPSTVMHHVRLRPSCDAEASQDGFDLGQHPHTTVDDVELWTFALGMTVSKDAQVCAKTTNQHRAAIPVSREWSNGFSILASGLPDGAQHCYGGLEGVRDKYHAKLISYLGGFARSSGVRAIEDFDVAARRPHYRQRPVECVMDWNNDDLTLPWASPLYAAVHIVWVRALSPVRHVVRREDDELVVSPRISLEERCDARDHRLVGEPFTPE